MIKQKQMTIINVESDATETNPSAHHRGQVKDLAAVSGSCL